MDKNYKQYLPKINFTLEVLLEGLRRTNLRIDNISGSGGGSQDLQSVIDKGGVAISYDNSNSSYVEFHQSGKEYPAPQLYLKSVRSDNESIINLFGGKIALQQENQDGYTKIVFNDPTSLTSLYFPSKPADGEYTLATLDDITGGSQNLQSVFDVGSFAYKTAPNGNQATFNLAAGAYGTDIILNVNTENQAARISMYNGLLILNDIAGLHNTTVRFEEPVDYNIGAVTTLNFPSKPTGTYTLATLDDILHINLDSRVYADNAAAITGGLVAKDLYRTATGELRIVV